MRKKAVSITLAVFLISCVGYAQPRDGRDNRQPPQNLPPQHRSDRMDRSQPRPEGDKHTQTRNERGRGDREVHSSNPMPPQSRPDRSERVQPPPERAERPRVQPPPNQPPPSQVQNQPFVNPAVREDVSSLPPQERGNLRPPTAPAPLPVTPAPSITNSPGSDVSYTENSNANGGQAISDIVSIVDQFLSFSSFFR